MFSMQKNSVNIALADSFFENLWAWFGIGKNQYDKLSDLIYGYIGAKTQHPILSLKNYTYAIGSAIRAYHAGLKEQKYVPFVEGTRTPEQAQNHQKCVDYVIRNTDFPDLRNQDEYKERTLRVRTILFHLFGAYQQDEIPLYFYSPDAHVEQCKKDKENYKQKQKSIAERRLGTQLIVDANDPSAHEIVCEKEPKKGAGLFDILHTVLVIAVLGISAYFLFKFSKD
jgi:hypothetical protein